MKVSANQCVSCKKYDDDLDERGICFTCEEEFNNAADDYYEYEDIDDYNKLNTERYQYLMQKLDNVIKEPEEERVSYFSHYDNEQDYHEALTAEDLLEHIPFDLEDNYHIREDGN